MDEIKKFHILPKQNIIKRYFGKENGKIKEWFNFSLESKNEIFKERKVSWREILIHELKGADQELLDAYNLIEEETRQLEQNWTSKRINEIINHGLGAQTISDNDRKFIMYALEKIIVFSGMVRISTDDENLNRHLTYKPHILAISNYLNYKGALSEPGHPEQYKYLETFLKKVNKLLNVAPFLYLLQIDNFLTSEPMQMKHIIINDELIPLLLFQVDPKYIIAIPLTSSLIIEFTNGEQYLNKIIFNIFYRQLDYHYLVKKYGINSNNKWEKHINSVINSRKPSFIYTNENLFEIRNYSKIIKENKINPNAAMEMKTKNKYNENEVLNKIKMINAVEIHSLFTKQNDKKINPNPKIKIMSKHISNILDIENEICHINILTFKTHYNGIERLLVWINDFSKGTYLKNYSIWELKKDDKGIYVNKENNLRKISDSIVFECIGVK